MKKNIQLMITLLVITHLSFSQNTDKDFVKNFTKIINDFPNHFQKIKGGSKKGGSGEFQSFYLGFKFNKYDKIDAYENEVSVEHKKKDNAKVDNWAVDLTLMDTTDKKSAWKKYRECLDMINQMTFDFGKIKMERVADTEYADSKNRFDVYWDAENEKGPEIRTPDDSSWDSSIGC